jgi:hypothetical protein
MRRNRDRHMHVVADNRRRVDVHLMRSRDFSQQFTSPKPNVPAMLNGAVISARALSGSAVTKGLGPTEDGYRYPAIIFEMPYQPETAVFSTSFLVSNK